MLFKKIKNTFGKLNQKLKVLIFSFVLLLVLFFIVDIVNNYNVAAFSEHNLLVERQVFSNFINQETSSLKLAIHNIKSNPKEIYYFQKKDRKNLYKISKPYFDFLKNDEKITQWSFFTDNDKMFLRMHNPSVYGDSVTRKLVTASRLNKKMCIGLEYGKAGFSLRMVKPIIAKNGKIIGYIELGQEVLHLVRQLEKEMDNQYAILINKKEIDHETYLQSLNFGIVNSKNVWNDYNDFVVVKDFSNAKIKFNKKFIDVPNNGKVLGAIKYKNKYYVRSEERRVG